MSLDLKMIFAGFGGQGVLFAGKVVTYAGLIEDKEITWLPSYGPEMRGGTANCSVSISDKPIGAPNISTPNVLVAMNLPSFDKFIDHVAPGGTVIVDSTLIPKKSERDDINAFYIPASELAVKNNLRGLSNIILTGKLFKELNFCSFETIEMAINKCVPKSKAQLIDKNLAAVKIGMEL